MSEELNRAPLMVELLRTFAMVFSPALLVMTIVIMLVVRYIPGAVNTSSLFSSGSGLSFGAILQIAGMSLFFAVFSVLFISQRFFPVMRFAYRLLFFFLSALITVSVFAITFNWIFIDDLLSWVIFISFFIVCYLISTGLTFVWLQQEKKKYGKLLADFKSRRG